LGLQAQSDAAREVFPTRVTQSYYRTLDEALGWFLFLALQTACNGEQIAFHAQLTVVVIRHQQLASKQHPMETKVRTRFLVIFKFKN
jgi:hypothetical protein